MASCQAARFIGLGADRFHVSYLPWEKEKKDSCIISARLFHSLWHYSTKACYRIRLMYHPTWNSDLCSGFNQNVYGWFNPGGGGGGCWLVCLFCCSFLKLEQNDMLWLAEAFLVLDASTSRCVWFKKLTSISIDHVQARTSSMSFHGKSSFYCADCTWLRENRDVPVEWTFSEIGFTVMRTSFDHDKLWNFMQRRLCAK